MSPKVSERTESSLLLLSLDPRVVLIFYCYHIISNFLFLSDEGQGVERYGHGLVSRRHVSRMMIDGPVDHPVQFLTAPLTHVHGGLFGITVTGSETSRDVLGERHDRWML